MSADINTVMQTLMQEKKCSKGTNYAHCQVQTCVLGSTTTYLHALMFSYCPYENKCIQPLSEKVLFNTCLLKLPI